MVADPPYSLRKRLLWLLLAAVLLAVSLQSWVAYRSALSETDEIFDYHMAQIARALGADGPVGSTRGVTAQAKIKGFDFVVQVWSENGTLAFQSAGTLPAWDKRRIGFFDAKAGGKSYRVYALKTEQQIIQVGQDLSWRLRIARSLAWRSVLPTIVLTPVLITAIWLVVTRALSPIRAARKQVAAREAHDLSPIDVGRLPEEVAPLVDELNSLLERLRRAFAAQTHFVADAAHELRSPLAALKLQLQYLQRVPDDATRAVAMARLGAGIDRGTRLVEQLLLLARQDASGAMAVNTEWVELSDLCLSVVSECLEEAQARDQKIEQALEPGTGLSGQPDALRILVRNLLGNAIKYTPPGGRILLSVSRPAADAVTLAVEDTGPGIAPEERERALARFYRGPGTSAGGSGLGLAIVKAIAERHGAAVRLDRSPLLQGLRVSVEWTQVMPRGEEAPGEATVAAAPATAAPA